MTISLRLLGMLVVMALLCGCRTGARQSAGMRWDARDSMDFAYPVTLRYAKHFSVENLVGYKKIHLFNTHNGDTLASYILALKGMELPEEVTRDRFVIRVPVQTIVCLASTHVGALSTLGLRERLIGAANVNNFWDTRIQEKIALGEIQEVGRGMKANPEQIIALHPEVVIKNNYSDNIKEEELEKIGIGTISYSDKREGCLLARAEWLKLMGILFCRNAQADSIFNNIEQEYEAARRIAARAADTPAVLIMQDYNGTWYMPGDRNYVVDMLRDAHAKAKTVPGVNTTTPCNFEKIYAEHWNDPYLLTLKTTAVTKLADFMSANERYGVFEACRKGNVFINNKRTKGGGGNDFWETGTFQPAVVLKDLISIFHPELLPDYRRVYIRKLE